MTRSTKGNCWLCGTRRCMRCGKCPNEDCENSVWCLRPEPAQEPVLRKVEEDPILALRRELGAEHQRLNHVVHGGGAP